MNKPSQHAEGRLERLLSKVGDMSYRRRILTICEYLGPAPGDLILDAGCGEGFVAIVLQHVYGCRVVGLDADREILSLGLSRKKGRWREFVARRRRHEAAVRRSCVRRRRMQRSSGTPG